jgi:hypothetical protein
MSSTPPIRMPRCRPCSRPEMPWRKASASFSPSSKSGGNPGGLNPAAWIAESEALKALQQEWMGRHAKLWQGMLGKAPDQPAPQVAARRPVTSASTSVLGRKPGL